MLKIQVIAAVIPKGGKFLLGKRNPQKKAAPGYWCPISGKIEPGELDRDAVVREVFEEVGLVVQATRKLCIFDTHDKTATIHWWLAEILSGEATLKNDEHTELGWFSIEEMKVLEPFFREDLEAFYKV